MPGADRPTSRLPERANKLPPRRQSGQEASRDRPPISRNQVSENAGIPHGIRTRVAAVKGRCPRPLDERDEAQPLVAAPAVSVKRAPCATASGRCRAATSIYIEGTTNSVNTVPIARPLAITSPIA